METIVIANKNSRTSIMQHKSTTFRLIRTFLLLFVLWNSTSHINAQSDIQAMSFHLNDADTTAIGKTTAVTDQYSGKKCALIKVETTESGFSFDVGTLGVIKVEPKNEIHPSEIWVYVPEGVKRITISHPLLGSLTDYDLKHILRSGKTYRLTLKTKEIPQAYGVLGISSTPAGYAIFIDGKPVGKTPLILKDVLVGMREVYAEKDGQKTQTYQILISQEQPVSLHIDPLNLVNTTGKRKNEPKYEPYAVLSNNNTILTFYYGSLKKERGGMSIGPFLWQNRKQNWNGHYADIVSVVFDASFANYTSLTSTANWFNGCTKLKYITGISNLKTDNVTDMGCMFYDCSNLTSLDLSHFNTRKVTSLESMFYNCCSLTSLDVSGFNTENASKMSSMFFGCYNLIRLDVSHFNTHRATSLKRFFSGCRNLTSLDISKFNTDNVVDIQGMFGGCSELKTIYVGDRWNIEKVTNSEAMFAGCFSLVGGGGTIYDTNQTDASYARIDGGETRPGYFTDIKNKK